MFGWRLTSGLVAVISGLLLCWIGLSVSAAPGQQAGRHEPILPALRLPGVVAVLFTVAGYVLAHNILYTCIAMFLIPVLLVVVLARPARVPGPAPEPEPAARA